MGESTEPYLTASVIHSARMLLRCSAVAFVGALSKRRRRQRFVNLPSCALSHATSLQGSWLAISITSASAAGRPLATTSGTVDCSAERKSSTATGVSGRRRRSRET